MNRCWFLCLQNYIDYCSLFECIYTDCGVPSIYFWLIFFLQLIDKKFEINQTEFSQRECCRLYFPLNFVIKNENKFCLLRHTLAVNLTLMEPLYNKWWLTHNITSIFACFSEVYNLFLFHCFCCQMFWLL